MRWAWQTCQPPPSPLAPSEEQTRPSLNIGQKQAWSAFQGLSSVLLAVPAWISNPLSKQMSLAMSTHLPPMLRSQACDPHWASSVQSSDAAPQYGMVAVPPYLRRAET